MSAVSIIWNVKVGHVVGCGLAVYSIAPQVCADAFHFVVTLRAAVGNVDVNAGLGGTLLTIEARLKPQPIYSALETYGMQVVGPHIEVASHNRLTLFFTFLGLDVYAQDAPPILVSLCGDAGLVQVLIVVSVAETLLIERYDSLLPKRFVLYHGSK